MENRIPSLDTRVQKHAEATKERAFFVATLHL